VRQEVALLQVCRRLHICDLPEEVREEGRQRKEVGVRGRVGEKESAVILGSERAASPRSRERAKERRTRAKQREREREKGRERGREGGRERERDGEDTHRPAHWQRPHGGAFYNEHHQPPHLRRHHQQHQVLEAAADLSNRCRPLQL
jgi:hypothetical protein